MQKEAFYTALSHPFSLSEKEREAMHKLTEEYPFFHAAQIMHLQNAYGEDKYERILQQAGIHIPNPRHYYRSLMFNKMYGQAELMEPEAQPAIEFVKEVAEIVETQPEEEEKAELLVEEKEPEALQYAPAFYEIQEEQPAVDFQKGVHDFTDWLQALEQSKANETAKSSSTEAQKTAAAISHFINKDKKTTAKPQSNEGKLLGKETHTPEQLMSQTLAEIYVKQQLYDKAIGIYEKLDLNSSEKNTTFARRIKEINELKE